MIELLQPAAWMLLLGVVLGTIIVGVTVLTDDE